MGTSAFPHDLPSINTDLALVPRAGASKGSSSKSGSKSKGGKGGEKSTGTKSIHLVPEVPKAGGTGIYLDKDSQTIKIYYGDNMAEHGSHIDYHYKAFPNANRRLLPTTKDKEGKAHKKENRDRAMKSVKSRADRARDEKKYASTVTEQGSSDDQETVMGCSLLESIREGTLKGAADRIHKDGVDGVGVGWRIEPIDHRSPLTKDVKGDLLKGLEGIEGYDTPKAKILTPKAKGHKGKFVDPNDKEDPADFALAGSASDIKGKGKQRQRRENIVDDVATTQGDPEHAESEGDQTDDFNNYLSPFQEAQKKASNIVTPILHDMVAGSTASEVFDAALSIYAELTYYPISVIGSPFHAGENTLDDSEDTYSKTLDANKDLKPEDKTDLNDNLLAFNNVLILKYERAWKKATEALDKEGLREEMPNLAGFLDVENEKAVPKEYLEPQKEYKEIDFLLPDKDGNYGKGEEEESKR